MKNELREAIGNRSHYVKIRLNDLELSQLKKMCLKNKLMMAEYIRRQIFKDIL
jgi:hypothetical protein